MSPGHVDRNLLFGFLALQNNFLTREDLIAAVSAWLVDKSRSLSDILRERRVLADDEFQLVAALAAKHLERHGNDPEKSLAALETIGPVCNELRKLGDPEVDASIVHVSISEGGGQPQFGATLSVDLSQSISSRYRVMRPHAKGGLGEVFVAKDIELNRDVALKEIQLQRANDPDSRARFMLEAEITGGLEHPGIVPVYGFGQYPDGRPYYAMRFIRGDTLKEAIDHFHSQPVRADAFDSVAFRKLINRFVDVCNAMEYAHSRGVLHRDLKPANIMLGRYGETLVVDWGLAKAKGKDEKHQSSDEQTLHPRSSSGSTHTIVGSAIGTPVYMSPEQAAGRLSQLGPTADIYSLGATLYSLLTGQTPFRKADSGSILQRVQKGDFKRPRELLPAIPKSLEAICLKAMALAPIDRYASTSALAEDLECWLADRPVTARRESVAERARRWARRHRAVVQSSAAALVLVTAIATVAAVSIYRAQKAEEAAKQRAQEFYRTARLSVDRWLPGVSEALRYAPGMAPMRKRLLESAIEEYEKFAQFQSDDAELEVERGRALLRLGEIQRDLGNLSSASLSFVSAESHFDELRQRLPAVADRARVEAGRARLRRGQLLAASDDQQALTVWRSTIELLMPEVADADAKQDRVLVLAAAHISVAEWLERDGQLQSARRELDAALKAFSNSPTLIPGKLPQEDPLLRSRLSALRLKARIESTEGKWQDAREILAQAASVVESIPLGDAEPWQLEAMADTHMDLAAVLRELGHFERASKSYAAALPAYRRLHETMPDSADYVEKIALALLDRAQLSCEQRRLPECDSDLKEALPMIRRLTSQFPEFSAYQEELAAGLDAQGRYLHIAGEFSDARDALQKSIDLFTRLSEGHPSPDYRQRAAAVRIQLACTLAALKLSDAADREFKTAQAVINELRTVAPEHPQFARDMAWLHVRKGGVHWERGELPAAKEEYQQAIRDWGTLMSRWPSPSHDLALADLLTNCPVETLRNSKQAVDLARQSLDLAPDEPLVRSTLALALLRLGKTQEALNLYGFPEGSGHPLARDDFVRALAAHAMGDAAKAMQYFKQGKRLQLQQTGDDDLRRLAVETENALNLTDSQKRD